MIDPIWQVYFQIWVEVHQLDVFLHTKLPKCTNPFSDSQPQRCWKTRGKWGPCSHGLLWWRWLWSFAKKRCPMLAKQRTRPKNMVLKSRKLFKKKGLWYFYCIPQNYFEYKIFIFCIIYVFKVDRTVMRSADVWVYKSPHIADYIILLLFGTFGCHVFSQQNPGFVWPLRG